MYRTYRHIHIYCYSSGNKKIGNLCTRPDGPSPAPTLAQPAAFPLLSSLFFSRGPASSPAQPPTAHLALSSPSPLPNWPMPGLAEQAAPPPLFFLPRPSPHSFLPFLLSLHRQADPTCHLPLLPRVNDALCASRRHR